MAWFRNHYECPICGDEWDNEWSCMCDDECPSCHHDITPLDSEDLTVVIYRDFHEFSVVVSDPEAENKPLYSVAKDGFLTRADAERYAAWLLFIEPGARP